MFKEINFQPSDFLSFPVSWSACKFSELFKPIKSKSKNPEDENILSLTQKGIIIKDISRNDGQIAESYDDYNLIDIGDISLNPMDLVSGWVDVSDYNGLISPAYFSYRNFRKDMASTEFVVAYLQILYDLKILFIFGKGLAAHDGRGRWTLPDRILMNLEIRFPPLDEQKNIINEYQTIKNSFLKQPFINEDITNYLKSLKIEMITGKAHV